MATLSQQEIKALEQTRQRLSQLTSSLVSLQQNVMQSDPLPSWSSLQSLASIISQNLVSVSQHLKNHHDLFASMVTYPLPSFPGRTQENLVGLLLRKKLEPNVEDWVAEGRDIANEATKQGSGSSLEQDDVASLWNWAGVAANKEARQHVWFGNYTAEEKEAGIANVDTGLRRKLKETPDDSSEEDDEEVDDDEPAEDGMEIVGVRRKSMAEGVDFEVTKSSEHKATAIATNATPIDDIFRFMMTGTVRPS